MPADGAYRAAGRTLCTLPNVVPVSGPVSRTRTHPTTLGGGGFGTRDGYFVVNLKEKAGRVRRLEGGWGGG